jgi:hypothetical protein
MAAKTEARNDETILLLKQLLAIELWRSGLTQAEIRARLGLGSDAITQILKGVSREVAVRIKPGD